MQKSTKWHEMVDTSSSQAVRPSMYNYSKTKLINCYVNDQMDKLKHNKGEQQLIRPNTW